MSSELDRLTLDIKRDLNGMLFDKEWRENHIPVVDRLIKINNKYEIKECPHCLEFFRGLN